MLSAATRPFGGATRLVVVLALGALFAAGARAQSDADVSVSAEARPTEVGTAGTVTFTIEVRGASRTEVQTPEPPSTTNLVLQGTTPRTQREVTFESGRLTRRLAFEWTYEPMRVGVARIQAATVRIRGDEYTTDEIRVRVVPQSQRSGPVPPPVPDPSITDGAGRGAGLAPRDLFIRGTVSTDTAYQNEQVTVEYRLFFRPGVRLRQSRMADAWDAPGFWREELDVASRPTPRAREMYGRTYKAIVLKRVALFPTRTGRLEVDPLRIETEARARPRLGRRDGPVPRSRYEPVTLSSEQLAVTARPLPASPPPAFDGAVGQFSLRARMRSDSVAVGEAVELIARIRGTGNIATVSPPALDAPSEVAAYDPSVETQIDRSGAEIRGTKTFTYTLVPRESGRYSLPPLQFAFFDPAAGRYRTLRTEPAVVRATGEAERRAASRTGEGLPVGDIAGPAERADRWVRADRRPLHARPWVYAVLLVPLLLAGGALAYRRRRTVEAETPRESRGLDAARPCLQEARRHLQDGEVRAFHRAVEEGLLAFLEVRLDLSRSASGMTGEALDRRLARRGATRSEREALHELLSVCSEVQFTPADPSTGDMTSTLDRAGALLRSLDDTLPPEPDRPGGP